MANGMTTDVYHRDNCIAPKRNQQTSRSVFSKNARLMWWLLALAAAHPSPHQLIIDTDMGRLGVDDVGAVCVALALVRLGEVRLLGLVHSGGSPRAVSMLSVLLEHYGQSSITAVGGYDGKFGRGTRGEWVASSYEEHLVSAWAHPVRNATQVPNAVAVYRRALARVPNGSATIAVIGFATNIAALLRSPPDQVSPLDGLALVAAKVKTILWQGGLYDAAKRKAFGHRATPNWGCGGCCGYRVDGCSGELAYSLGAMPSNVAQVFSDVGSSIRHSLGSSGCKASGPCHEAYLIQDHQRVADHGSWDPLVILAAVRGAAAAGCELSDFGFTNVVDSNGVNTWLPPSAQESRYPKNSSRLKLKEGPKAAAAAGKLIEGLVCDHPSWVKSSEPKLWVNV